MHIQRLPHTVGPWGNAESNNESKASYLCCLFCLLLQYLVQCFSKETRFLITSHVGQNTPNAQSLRIILFVVWATSDPAGNLLEVERKGSAVA